MTYDPIERLAPQKGLYSFTDGVSLLNFNANDEKQRDAYQQAFIDRFEQVDQLSKQLKKFFFSVATNDSIISTIKKQLNRYV